VWKTDCGVENRLGVGNRVYIRSLQHAGHNQQTEACIKGVARTTRQEEGGDQCYAPVLIPA
jgi:hypothetical protein